MHTFRLELPSLTDKAAVMKFRDDFLMTETHIAGSGHLEDFTEYDVWLEKVHKDLHGSLEPGRVRATQYLPYDGDTLVGMIQLRHSLNEYLENFGGHIGYCVHPNERRKGYASAMLKACKQKAAELGIKRILITCDDDNAASEGVICKAGGKFEDTRTQPDNKPTKRFWLANTSIQSENLLK
ncbi:MAG TPA: GNAT family N-acetyltransferase [Candidatus Saccharibacteria bacterium]|nr:GNAT family N-acetyltransferase [Candidatus Saccharibacteria bacterium]HRK94271.1 GNAT family N-acetyltransferase [Candidatus Saccharibacteria bacterium]